MARKIPRWALREAARDSFLDRSALRPDLRVEYEHLVTELKAHGYEIKEKPAYKGNVRALRRWSRFTTVIPAGDLVGADNILALGDGWAERSLLSRVATLRHELVHMRQVAAHDPWIFAIRYLTSQAWRWVYEVQAYRLSIAVLAMAGEPRSAQVAAAKRIARNLRGSYSLRRLRASDVIDRTEELLLAEVK